MINNVPPFAQFGPPLNFTAGKPSTVTGTVYTTGITDSGGKVTFKSATVGSSYNSQTNIDLTAGSKVTVDAKSWIDLYGDEPYVAGHLYVDNSKLTVNGRFDGVDGFRLTNGSSLTVSGNGAELHTLPYAHQGVGEFAVDATSHVDILNSGTLIASPTILGGSFNISGNGSSFQIGSGSAPTSTAQIVGENGGTFETYAGIVNNGSITASRGVFHVYAKTISGTGILQIDHGGTLDLSGSNSEAVQFLTNAELELDKGMSQTGFLQGFGIGDKVDLAHQPVSSVVLSEANGDTTLAFHYSGATVNPVETVTLQGQYSASNFYVHPDSSGGTMINYEPHATHMADAIPLSVA